MCIDPGVYQVEALISCEHDVSCASLAALMKEMNRDGRISGAVAWFYVHERLVLVHGWARASDEDEAHARMVAAVEKAIDRLGGIWSA